MDKKSIALMLLTSCLAGSTFATTFINKIIAQNSHDAFSIQNTHRDKATTHRDFTDFSGTWVVNCGDGLNATTVIENDSDDISFDGQEFKIGYGLQSTTAANDDSVDYEHTSFEWNENGTALIMKGIALTKKHIAQSPLQTLSETFTLTMQNGQINFDGKIIEIEGTKHSKPYSMHCVLTKQQ